MATLPVLRPSSFVSGILISTSTVGNVNDASDATFVVSQSGNEVDGQWIYELGNTPADFASMDSNQVTVKVRCGVSATGDDTWRIRAELLNSSNVLVSNAPAYSTLNTATTAVQEFSFTLTHTGTNNKAAWDGLRLVLDYQNVKTKGLDGNAIRIYDAWAEGTYTQASTDRRAQISFAELEVPNAPRRAQISFAELEIPTPLPTSITDDFSGDLSQWADLSTDSATFVIDTGELLMTTGATGVGEARAQALIQDVADVEVLLLHTPGTADLVINVRSGGIYNSGSDVPDDGYSLVCNESGNNSLALYSNVAGVQSPVTGGTTTRPNSNPTWVRFRVVGTTIQAKAWEDGTSEPGTWGFELTDSTVTGAGSVELTTWRNGGTSNTVRVDDVSIGPENTDRRAQVSFTELEIPNAPRRAQVSFTELEIPNAARRAQISWSEVEIPNAARRGQVSWSAFEIPNAPRRAQVSFTEIEIPNAARRGQISFTELEIPTAPRRAQVSFTELELPNGARRGQISFTELEIPNAARRAQVSWTELEIPIRDRIAEVSWAEFEIGTAPRRAQISWAELELPETLRGVQVSFAEFEIGDAPRRAQISFVEVEMPDAARRGQVSFTEIEIPNAARKGMVSWAEFEIPNAARRVQVSFAEIEMPDAPRRAQISMAFIEIPELLAGETLRLRTQLRMGE